MKAPPTALPPRCARAAAERQRCVATARPSRRSRARGLVYPCVLLRGGDCTRSPGRARRGASHPGRCRTRARRSGRRRRRGARSSSPAWSASTIWRLGPPSAGPDEQCGDLLLRDRLGQWTYQFRGGVSDDCRPARGCGDPRRGPARLHRTPDPARTPARPGRAAAVPPPSADTGEAERERTLSKVGGENAGPARVARGRLVRRRRGAGEGGVSGGLQAERKAVSAAELETLFRVG
jgi:hypothetical protein